MKEKGLNIAEAARSFKKNRDALTMQLASLGIIFQISKYS